MPVTLYEMCGLTLGDICGLTLGDFCAGFDLHRLEMRTSGLSIGIGIE